MKKKVLLVLIGMMTMATVMSQYYDFSAMAPSGQTLYYKIVNGEAHVVRPGTGNSYNNYVTGDLEIPSSVSYNGRTYAVTALDVIGNNICGSFENCPGITSVTIPNSVSTIGSSAFYSCSGLTSVTIPNSVTSMGDEAFSHCTALNSVTIPNSVTSIGDGVFRYCTGLTSVTIPNSVIWIGSSAFADCSGLTAITIPNSVTSIGQGAFSGCSGLASVSIPNSVTSIGDGVFRYCTGLTSVTIPNSVTSIGSSAFFYVKHIEYYGSATGSPWGAISMNGVTEGDFVYSDVTKHKLTAYIGTGGAVTIPSTVDTIGNRAFYKCSSLTSVTIPNSVTIIDNDAFYSCSGLTSVNYTGTVAQWCNISFSSLTSNPIYYAHSLSINGNPVTNLVIPNSVTSIGNNAFYGCSSLTSVTIPNSVTSIGANAFLNCSSLDTVYMMPTTPPSLGSSAFSNNASGRVFILNGCAYDNYYTTVSSDSWYSYRNDLRHPIYDINVNISTSDSIRGTADVVLGPSDRIVRCDSTAIIQATANYGYYFTYWNDGVTENPRTLTLTQDTTFTAHFAPNQYTLTVNAGEHGTATGSGTYNFGDTIMIQAFPEEHYHFTRWNDGNTENPRQYRIEEDITLTAFFVIDTYTVSVTSSDPVRGMVTQSGTEFVYLTPCTVEATAYTGYVFAGWSNGVTANPYTFAVISDVELTALFVEEGEEVYTVTVESADPTMGTVSGGGQALSGGTVTISAIPNEGHRFLRWNDGNTENPREVTVTGNVTYTAYFESTQGIEDIDASEVKIYAAEGQIVVESGDGEALDEVRVFDVMGRCVAVGDAAGRVSTDGTKHVTFEVPGSGIYIVKIGDLPARKIVVIR